jgi:hypothetical protein
VSFDSLQMTPLAQILAGSALLLFGRRLFWLFVGVVGFLVGMRLGTEAFHGKPELIVLLIAVGVGILAALFAIVLQKAAVALAGGLAGGLAAIQIFSGLGATGAASQWIFFGIGAVLAAVLLLFVFDWALIVLSALSGASLVSDALPIDHTARLIATAVLFVVGLFLQGRALAGRSAA